MLAFLVKKRFFRLLIAILAVRAIAATRAGTIGGAPVPAVFVFATRFFVPLHGALPGHASVRLGPYRGT